MGICEDLLRPFSKEDLLIKLSPGFPSSLEKLLEFFAQISPLSSSISISMPSKSIFISLTGCPELPIGDGGFASCPVHYAATSSFY